MSNWEGVNDWYGTDVTSDRVIVLELSDNYLNGSIPPELGNLSNLEALVVGGNVLSGSIPPELASLSNLVWLDLARNELSGSIPPE